jgi:acyl-CoA reductase-like NAD-dependent aldehyde dehydrogenase
MSQEKITSINPATLETVGEVTPRSSEECREAIQKAIRAFPEWSRTPFAERQKIFRRAKQILLRRKAEISRLITDEKGSPLLESLSVEVWGVLEALDYYSYNMHRLLKTKKMRHHVSVFRHKKGAFHFQPLGPTLIISPWNFPFLIGFSDTLSALISGNTVVLRPSTSTPLIGLAIGEILEEAGLPPGVLNVTVCKIPQAEEMITDQDIQTVMFTGSTTTGKRILELVSQNLTNIVLELGGNDPMLVLKDADLDRTAKGAVWAGFMNCGQSCGAVERAYVAKEVASKFTEKVVNIIRELKVGNPIEPDIDIGPMATRSQLETVKAHIEDAKQKGAKVVWGGNPVEDLQGYFIRPSVLTGMDHSMLVMKEETFGPVLPIMSFSDLEEGISLANDSIYGLTASVWTTDRKTARQVAEKLEVGTVTVNDHMTSFVEPAAIWGGIKQTGIGRSHGPYGMLNLVNIKFTSQDHIRKKKLLWWYPYDRALTQILEQSLTIFHHRRLWEKMKALPSLLPHLGRIKAGLPLKNFIKSLPYFFRK